MNFMDQIAGAGMGPQSQGADNPPQAGQMGPTTRPKQRFVDKILMKQRDRTQGQMSGPAGAAPAPPFTMGR